MSFTRKSIADHLDSYDDEIATLQEGKRETLADYRQQLADAGMSKGGIKAEIEALKVAMRRRRAIAKKGEEVVEEADVLADEIFVEITARAPRATRVREIIEEYDAETGEIHDTQDQPETATGSGRTAQVCGEGMAPPLPAGAADAVCSTPAASVSDAIARKDHQSVSPSSPDGSASTESAAGKVSKLAQPSPPKQAEPIKAGEGVPPLSPAILSDEEVVPAFLRKSAEPVINERCERPTDCKYAHHPNKVTCSTCSTAWAIAQKKAAA